MGDCDPLTAARESLRDFSARETHGRLDEDMRIVLAALAAAEQAQDELKAALASECEVAQNTARFVREERERAEAAEQAQDALRLRAENAEQDRDTLRRDLARGGQAVRAAEQARDQALADAAIQQQRAGATQVLLDRAEARLATRGALEAAARAWARHRTIARDPQTESADYWANTTRLVEAERALAEAVAALDAAPGEAG